MPPRRSNKLIKTVINCSPLRRHKLQTLIQHTAFKMTEKCVLFVINPHAGKGNTVQIFENEVKPSLEERKVKYEVVKTAGPHHGFAIAQSIDLGRVCEICIISGDGIVHEVVNGLLNHKDFQKAIAVPISLYPGGSGNGVLSTMLRRDGWVARWMRTVRSQNLKLERAGIVYLTLQYGVCSPFKLQIPELLPDYWYDWVCLTLDLILYALERNSRVTVNSIGGSLLSDEVFQSKSLSCVNSSETVEHPLMFVETKSFCAVAAMTLCWGYIADCGRRFADLETQYRVSKASIRVIIPETCRAIYSALKDTQLRVPRSSEDWLKIAEGYLQKWNFPNCVGAIDGKHVMMRLPAHAGSTYYNYKGFNSIVLMAVVDAELKFIYVDVGEPGRSSDGGTWNACSLKAAIEADALNLPHSKPLPGRSDPVPHVFVGDAAFAAKPYLVKPYPETGMTAEKRISNYRISRARRCVENAFGLLGSRFGVYSAPFLLSPPVITDVVLATVVLHNYLRSNANSVALYCPPSQIDVEDVNSGAIARGSCHTARTEALQPLASRAGNLSRSSAWVRDEFCAYFNGEGEVPWQRRSAGLREQA